MAGLLFTRGSGGISSVAPNSVGVIDAKTNKLIDQVPVGVNPVAIAAGASGVWAANVDEHTISRIDPTNTSARPRTITVGDYPSDIALGDGTVWVALGSPAEVMRINTSENRAASPISALGGATCGSPFASAAVGGRFVWLACESADLGRVDPRTSTGTAIGYSPCGLLTSPTSVSPRFSDIAFGLRSLWIVNRAANSVVQLDPTTCERLGGATTGKGPVAIAVGPNSLWVANHDDDTVTRIDVPGPGEAMTVTPIPVGDGPVDVAVGEGAVWVANGLGRSVTRIDPESGKVVETIKLGNEPQRIAAGAGKVWVTVQAPEKETTGS